MSTELKLALKELDPSNDLHWTTDGLPRLDILKDKTGKAVTRSELTEFAKGFTRTNPSFEVSSEVPEVPEDPDSQVERDEDTSESNHVDLDESEDPDSQVERELDEARVNLTKAQERFNTASAAMDKVIIRRSTESSKQTFSHTIQQYQQSQQKQRALAAAQQKAMVDAMLAVKNQY